MGVTDLAFLFRFCRVLFKRESVCVEVVVVGEREVLTLLFVGILWVFVKRECVCRGGGGC